MTFFVIVTTMKTIGCQDQDTTPIVTPAPQVTMPTSKFPWKNILENSCKKFPFKELCKFRDVITGSQSWQVLKLLGGNGSNIVQKDVDYKKTQSNAILAKY